MDDKNASQLHQESIIVDGLNASHFLDERVLQRLHQGGVTAVNATIAAWHTLPETMDLIADCLYLFQQQEDLIMPVHSLADIETAKATNRVGLILGFQGTDPIHDNTRLLAVYHALGVRIMQLTYNHQNLVGCGCMVPEDEGLTEFGREVIAEMNRLGILVDVSHCGPRTTLEAIEASRRPIAFTHANPRAICAHTRNKTDEAFKALAARGGVVGAVVFAPLLTGSASATLNDYLATIDYLVELVGLEHVGLGPDFMEEMPEEVAVQALKGMPPEVLQQFAAIPPTEGFDSISACPNVTRGLLARGYSEENVKKIMGR
ncbi:MAG: membrane dipeptidase [Chloroflexota bacterium]